MDTIVIQILGFSIFVGLFGLLIYFRIRIRQRRWKSGENSDYLNELSAKGKISQENFDGISKIQSQQKKYGIIIGIVAIAIIFAIVSAYAMYMTTVIDCHQPLSHYPSSYNRFYTAICEHH